MIAYLIILVTGSSLTELVHTIAHHRAELAGLVLTVAAFIAHRTRRWFVSTGVRANGMPPLPPWEPRKATDTTALEAA